MTEEASAALPAPGSGPIPSAAVRLVSLRLDALPVGRWHRRVIGVVGLASFFNFFEVALGTVLMPLLPAPWTATTLDKSLIIGAPFAGEMLGALLLSRYADRFGRRWMFRVNLIGYAVPALACAAAPSATALIVLRLLVGAGLGAELTLVDTYLAELMPAARRGRLMVRSYALGMLAVPIAGVLAALLPHSLAGLSSWRWITLLNALGAVLVWRLCRRLPESPRWLAERGRTAEALDGVARIEEQYAIQAGERPAPASAEAAAARPGSGDHPGGRQSAEQPTERPEIPRLLSPPLIRRTLLLFIMQLLDPIGFYGFASIAPLVLMAKGFGVVHSLGYTALTALGYPLGTLLLLPLSELIQRRTLTILSTLLTAAAGCAFGMATATPLVLAAGGLMSVFSVLHSTVSRAYEAELFPTAVRNTALGNGYAVSRLVSAVLPFAALSLLGALGATALYATCAALLVVLAIAVAALGPRTNSRRLEDI
ncbi:MFS transporter [Phaeacidiphilus oryzae]|uniref:MFS transporter n=1 Tax=Phaeacidiphilus oryzae TaxID=348818 RepID=UPI000AC3174E|nr:MFS transporter [Phaeacidiphilus oryzae]